MPGKAHSSAGKPVAFCLRPHKVSQRKNKGLFFPQIDVDETELRSITGQLNRAVQIELSHDAVTVVFNRFGADVKFICNLLCRQSFGQKTHDLLFPSGQQVVAGG